MSALRGAQGVRILVGRLGAGGGNQLVATRATSTILSTPSRYIDTAFQMFDITGGGHINAKEFAYVSTYMTQRVGGFGNVRMPAAIYNEDQQKEVLGNNSGLMSYFFGKDRDGKIGKKEFYQFHKNFLDEVIELLFYEYEPNLQGHISEVEFCAFLLEHSSLTHSKKMKMLEKVKKK